MRCMLADTAQTFGVILIVVAAVGYLLLLARRSWRQGGGCGCCGAKKIPFMDDAAERVAGESSGEDRVPSKQVIPPSHLEDAAGRLKPQESPPRPDDPTK
jgi:hypothetical protein